MTRHMTNAATSRSTRPARKHLLTAAALLALAPLTLPPAPATAQTMVNLRDADIRVFIDDVAKVTGASFVVDPRVQGKVSVVSDRALSSSAYFELFLATLRAHGFTAVPMGRGQYRIQPAEPGAGAGSADSSRFATAVIPLSSIDAAQAVESLRPILSRNGSASANRQGNAIILADFADNIARARAVLREIDRDRATAVVVPLKNAGARDLAQSLTTLVRQPGAGGQQGGLTVVAVDTSNAIAIRGEPRQVEKIAALARDLDQRAEASSNARVIFLQHAEAASVMPVLQQLMGQTPTTTAAATNLAGLSGTPFGSRNQQGENREAGPMQPIAQSQPVQPSAAGIGVASGDPRRNAIIARYEGANALIISAEPQVQKELGEVIRQLDTPRAQIHVEAIIVEISDTAAKQLGVQFLLGGNGSDVPFMSTNFSNAAPNLLAIAGAVAAERGDISDSDAANSFRDAAVSSLLGTTGGTGGFGTISNNLIFGFVLNAVKSDVNSNILSTPSVLTLDNQPARILVGQEIPVTTGEALGNNLDNSFRTVQRQDVGIQLSVKPQINAGGTVTLAIRQVVSSIASTVAERDFVLNKREIETAVTVGDGQILALGGLLDDNERRSIQKVPLLGDIPGIGELFKSRSNTREKTNLMIFIRPTIVRDQPQAAELTANRWGQIRDQQIAREGVSSLDALAWSYLRTPPPYQPLPFPPQPEAPAPEAGPAPAP